MIFDFLSFLSFIFELCALIVAFCYKNTRIFFLTLLLIGAHLPYFYTSVFQAHLFNSLFIPLVFTLLALIRTSNLLQDKRNCIQVFLLLFIGILSLFLPKSTNFTASNLHFDFISFFDIPNEFALVFFFMSLFCLILHYLKRKELYLLLAFLGANVQFFFIETWISAYFEFASFIFCIYLLYQNYKIAFFDSNTKLANEKKLHYYIKGKEQYYVALLHFKELQYVQEAYAKLFLKHIAKILKRLKLKIFIVNDDFVFIFDDENTALNHLAYLESLLKNTEFCIENENFKLEFQICLEKNALTLQHTLKSLEKNFSRL
ncbi:hypothetical protein OQH60_08145 [Campylobacter sp. MIT 21-1685]|uniref:hypothetical protein n=1 Tax=unclassified Campylobacter TaxID=2593542 RepID=UPI00224B309B|nr:MULTISPECIES: hypothetical protein [unclassified Campylobacter]MCX2683830.1 hypothetical protein [Campylobacter sp. MIT 21-1684]MCX2752114.1 hypothetical protein [Campylobacter sp. MIT 21-1682]MCX2808307.1 hypothetical protein [Campylobacter sp. MIT 21-1685]